MLNPFLNLCYVDPLLAMGGCCSRRFVSCSDNARLGMPCPKAPRPGQTFIEVTPEQATPIGYTSRRHHLGTEALAGAIEVER